MSWFWGMGRGARVGMDWDWDGMRGWGCEYGYPNNYALKRTNIISSPLYLYTAISRLMSQCLGPPQPVTSRLNASIRIIHYVISSPSNNININQHFLILINI